MNSNETISQRHNDEIDLKDVFKTIFRYKYSIILITLLFMIVSTIFAYSKPSIYSASSTIELMENKKSASTTDFMLQAFDGASANVDKEIQVFKSRFLAQKVFSYLNLKTRYFTSHNFREIELYKNSPFVVTSTSAPYLSIDFRVERIELVGFTANRTITGCPVVIPPNIPPAVLLRKLGSPSIIRISSDALSPGMAAISNPAPISTAFTAFIDIIALAKSLSIFP